MKRKKLEFIGISIVWAILLVVIFVYRNLPFDDQIMLALAAVGSIYGSYQRLQRNTGTNCLATSKIIK